MINQVVFTWLDGDEPNLKKIQKTGKLKVCRLPNESVMEFNERYDRLVSQFVKQPIHTTLGVFKMKEL